MAYRSITKRWMFNSLGVIIVVLILVECALGIGVKNYYYSSVRQSIIYNIDYAYSNIVKASSDPKLNFKTELRNLVETFKNKDKMEMMAIGYDRSVLVTSSGFSYPAGNMPDYEEALTASDGMGYYVGKDDAGEKVMAITRLVPVINSDYSAIRYVVSLEMVDRVIWTFILALTGVMLLILVLVLVSGSYFIKSIVKPVRELGSMAREFAGGDMSARILKKSEDEIGELCDIIN